MRILFATAHSYLPQRVGGSELSTHDLCLALLRRGLDPRVYARLRYDTSLGWVELLRARSERSVGARFDERMGYPAYRRREPARDFRALLDRLAPSVAVIQVGRIDPMVETSLAAGVPTVRYVRDVAFAHLESPMRERKGLRYIANSHFTARRLAQEFGLEALPLPPLVSPERYRTESSRETVVFINPVRKKGIDIAMDLAARRPDIPFDFVECWPQPSVTLWLRRRRARRLGNVRWWRPVMDMREIYGRARVVLAPSVWEEPWCRVATEAQISGIPVLASNRGGLAESVGPGGMLVDPDAGGEVWARALGRLWDDPAAYREFADAALEHSRRAEIRPEEILSRFTKCLDDAISG